MKRALLVAAAVTLGIVSPAGAAPWESEKRHKDRGPAVAAAVVGAVIGLELAQRDRRNDRRDDEPQQAAPVQARISLEQAMAAIARSTPGRKLDAQQVSRNGQPFWEIRWQTNDGRRIDYVVDGSSGRIVSSRGG